MASRVKCSKCMNDEYPCHDCRQKMLDDLTKQLYEMSPWYYVVLFKIVTWWSDLGWLPYRLKIVKLKL